MAEPMLGRPGDEEWARLTTSPDWPSRVLQAAEATLRASPPRTARVASIGLAVSGAETVLAVVYDYAPFAGTLGLARSLRVAPPVGRPTGDPAAWLAEWVIAMEVDVPIGRLYELLRPDEDGIRWWGAGHPDVGDPLAPRIPATEHPTTQHPSGPVTFAGSGGV